MYLEKSTFSYAHTSIKKKKGVLNFENCSKSLEEKGLLVYALVGEGLPS